MDLLNRRQQIIMLLLTAIFLSFTVSTFANMVFTWYPGNSAAFWLLIPALILIISGVTYVVFAGNKQKPISVTFMTLFDLTEGKFIDIPNTITSVHARYLWDKIPQDQKIQWEGDWSAFEKSDFHRFLNLVAIETILSYAVDDYQYNFSAPHQDVSFSDTLGGIPLSDLVKGHFRLLSDLRVTVSPCLPLIRVHSKSGYVDFSWSIGYITHGARYTEPYTHIAVSQDPKSLREFIIEVSVIPHYNFIKVFSADLVVLSDWVESVEKNLREVDWNSIKTQLSIMILRELSDKIMTMEKTQKHLMRKIRRKLR